MKEQLSRKGIAKNWSTLDALGGLANDPVRLKHRKRCDIERLAVPSFAIATGAMVGLSAPALIEPASFGDWLKVGLLSTTAALVSYVINKLAIDDGSELSARGYWSAGIASVGSIVFVGGGLFASTYAGLTIDRVESLSLQQHGQALSHYVAKTRTAAGGAAQLGPALKAALTDINAHVACEESESCLSGRGSGGRGPVTRALEPVAKRAAEMAARLGEGEQLHAKSFLSLNQRLDQYQKTASDGSLSRSQMRQALSRIDSAIKQTAGSIHQATPTALLNAYSAELSNGITISGRPIASERINTLLARHGASLKAALAGSPPAQPVAPAFPHQAGVSETFTYIAHFLPIAALTAVIELIMPLTLWVYALLSHFWRNYKTDPTDLDREPRSKRGR